MGWLTEIALCVGGLFALVLGFWKWGKTDAEKERSEKIAEELKHDSEIISKPFTDKPFGRMRRRKD